MEALLLDLMISLASVVGKRLNIPGMQVGEGDQLDSLVCFSPSLQRKDTGRHDCTSGAKLNCRSEELHSA